MVRDRRHEPLDAAVGRDHRGPRRLSGFRSGNINPLLYLLATTRRAAGTSTTSPVGAGQQTTNNGLFPTTPGYDKATGLGTPKMTALITQSL